MSKLIFVSSSTAATSTEEKTTEPTTCKSIQLVCPAEFSSSCILGQMEAMSALKKDAVSSLIYFKPGSLYWISVKKGKKKHQQNISMAE